MKSKKFDKRLRLNKTTVSTLTNMANITLQEVRAGIISTICKTCGHECTYPTRVDWTCLC
jgi:uncharacterized OB-fold protein